MDGLSGKDLFCFSYFQVEESGEKDNMKSCGAGARNGRVLMISNFYASLCFSLVNQTQIKLSI